MSAVVIGVGNPYRSDDGAGPAVSDLVHALQLPGVTVVESDGEPSRLLDLWDGVGLAIVVDAVRADGVEPGTIDRNEDLGAAGAQSPASSHGVGVDESWGLGEVLGRLPERLIVYGIVGARFDVGEGLSPAVAGALGEVVNSIVGDLRVHQTAHNRG